MHLHIARLLEAISNVIIFIFTFWSLFRADIHQNHEPTGLVMSICKSHGTVSTDAAQKLHVLVPNPAVDAIEGGEGRTGDEEAMGRIPNSLEGEQMHAYAIKIKDNA